MPRSYKLLDLELAPYVTDWGKTEEIKDVLLAQSQLFTAQHTLVVANPYGMFSPKNSKSIFYGRSSQLIKSYLSQDGNPLFSGFIRSIEPDHASRTVNILSENAFTVPANSIITFVQNGVNPVYAIKTILTSAGLGNYIDNTSFSTAGASFSTAGATINLNYPAGSNVTALSAIQAISSLCSMSCFVQSGLIKVSVFRPYQGGSSGIKWNISSKNVYDFGGLIDAYINLSNSVTITYGASLSLYLKNAASIKTNGIETNTAFQAPTSASLAVPDLVSATYFGNNFLSRASNLRQVGHFRAGPELVEAHIGDRILVNAPNWGTSAIAFEIIETHVTIASSSVEIVCGTI